MSDRASPYDPRNPLWRGTKCKDCGDKHPGIDSFCSYCKTKRIESIEKENAALREQVKRLEATIDYVTEETGYYTPPQESEK